MLRQQSVESDDDVTITHLKQKMLLYFKILFYPINSKER